MRHKRRGQLGVSFQWIFVLLAGGAFLFFFLFAIRGCTSEGEARVQGVAIASTVSKLESMVWQGDTTTNITVQESTVSCPGATLTLRSDQGTSTLERTPVFLPPEISGTLSVRTAEVLLGKDTESPIPLGSVMYGLDQDTYYLVIQDSDGNYIELLQNLPHTENIKILSPLSLSDPENFLVPSTARTAIVVSASQSIDPSVARIPQSPEQFLGVKLHWQQTASGGAVTFYAREGDRLVEDKVLKYDTPYLATGAMVSGVPETYQCGKDVFVERLQLMTRIYEHRARNITLDPQLRAFCASTLEDATQILYQSNTQSDDEQYLSTLFTAAPQLLTHQLTLLDNSCPVIA